MPGSENSTAIMFYYVYVLESQKNGSLYIGYTNNLRKRIVEHNRKMSFSTKLFTPWQIIHYEAYRNKEDAKRRERTILKPVRVVDYSNEC